VLSWVAGIAPTQTLLLQDAGAVAWTITPTVGASSLDVIVTGEVGKTIRWNATIIFNQSGARNFV
jgi:hypothetical protein